MFDFKKEKEYYIEVSPKLFIKHVCKKIKKNTKGEIIFIVFYFPWNSVTKIYSVEEMNNFISVIEPVDNTEFFSMYINWLNFYRPGPHQDLTFAKFDFKTVSLNSSMCSNILSFAFATNI